MTHLDIQKVIGSCFPFMYVVSQESENLVVDFIRDAIVPNKEKKTAGLPKFRCFDWSRTEGLRAVDGEANPATPQETMDVNSALDIIQNIKSSCVVIMRHLHFEFKNGGNPHVIRKLQDHINTSFKEEDGSAIAKIIIVVAPVEIIPEELARNTTLVDFPLQDFDAVNTKIDKVSDDLEVKFKKKISSSERNAIVKATQGLTNQEMENGLYLSISTKKTLDPLVLSGLKSQIVRRNGLVDCIEDLEDANNLGGFDRFKTWIQDRKAGFTVEGQNFGLAIPKGVLLIGLQGSGKTMCAKVVANIFNVPLYKLDLGKMFSSLVGQSEQKTREVLKTLEAVAPCVVLFDEIEKGLAGLESSGKSDAGTTSRVIGTILQWLNDKKSPVFVIATSNNIKAMPPELLRAGRFDGVWFVSLPSLEERKQIFDIHLKKVKRDSANFDLKLLAKKSEDYSGAEIEQVIKEGLYKAYGNGQKDLDTDNLLDAIESIVPLYKTAKEQLKEIYTWVGYEPSKKDGVRAKFVSSHGLKNLDNDVKKIGFHVDRMDFVTDGTETQEVENKVEVKK